MLLPALVSQCHPYWFKTGFRLKSEEYIKCLPEVKNFIDSIVTKHEAKDWVFAQDGAPAHTADLTQKYLTDNWGNQHFWPKSFWPPSSPDCNPLDYSIWAQIQATACKNRHMSIDDLKRDVDKAWEELNED